MAEVLIDAGPARCGLPGERLADGPPSRPAGMLATDHPDRGHQVEEMPDPACEADPVNNSVNPAIGEQRLGGRILPGTPVTPAASCSATPGSASSTSQCAARLGEHPGGHGMGERSESRHACQVELRQRGSQRLPCASEWPAGTEALPLAASNTTGIFWLWAYSKACITFSDINAPRV